MLIVGLGGAVGAICRYFLGIFITKSKLQQKLSFPLAMFVVNFSGSLGLGVFMRSYYHIGSNGVLYDNALYLLVGIGFFGAFTTFSTFSLEVITLIRENKLSTALLYILCTIFVCVAAFFIGYIWSPFSVLR
ncbi:fluoride efflux transporter CrcB [Bacillus sp. Marseille-P3661]|uniref:fluoride efflux transporter CrcB n=1 Tax=Bacillus sp. Marseille-P3661 TaxID=1936234 RepID=UPI00215501CB|nr:fluoride efflux transporter CrcB [Bacillus sp. Marseille-P3661]